MRIRRFLPLLAVVNFSVPDLVLAADGCAEGTYSRVRSPDGNATSYLFDDFSATAGGASGIRRATTRCSLSVPVTQPDGHSVYAMDYRGFVSTSEGQAVSIQALKDRMEILKYEASGPVDADVAVGGKVGVSGSSTLDLTVLLTSAGPLDDEAQDAILFLDTIDFARLGFTTTRSVVDSMNQIAHQRQSIALDLSQTALTLLGQSERFDSGSYVSLSGNSYAAAGFNARWEAGSGFSLLGGATRVSASASDALSDDLALFAGGIRYTTAPATWRAFGEAGAWGSPDVSASLTRSYMNIDEMIQTGGATSGSLFASYARVGVIYAPDDTNELALSTRFARSWLDLDGYGEDKTDNLFAARMGSGSTITDSLGAELAWSRKLDERFDLTLSLGVGRTSADKKGVEASVDWVGDVKGSTEDQNYAALGGRIGWMVTEKWQVNTSAAATFREDADPVWSIGGQLKASF